MFVIFVNCVTLAMYDPLDKRCQSTSCQVLESIEHFVFAFFLAEMVLKMVAMGVIGKKGYLQDKWNRLDCFIVTIGYVFFSLRLKLPSLFTCVFEACHRVLCLLRKRCRHHAIG